MLRAALLCIVVLVAASGVLRADEEAERFGALAKELGFEAEAVTDPLFPWRRRQGKAIELLRAGSFEALDAHLDGLPPLSQETPDEQGGYDLVFRSLANRAQKELAEPFAAWLAARPKSPHVHAIHAECLINQAWAARGTGYAPSVSQGGWKVWGEKVPQAVAANARALELAPDHRWALVHRVHLDRCSGPDAKVRQAHYEAGRRADPTSFTMHTEYFQASLPRYYGTWEQAWKVVRAQVEAYPNHETTLLLLHHAHMVCASEGGPEGTKAYWRRPEVREELLGAMERVRKHQPGATGPAELELGLTEYFHPGADAVFRSNLVWELACKGDAKRGLEVARQALERGLGGETLHAVHGILLRQARSGTPGAIGLLQRAMIGGSLSRPSHPRATFLLMRWLALEDPTAHVNVHLMRLDGIGVEADPERALADLLAEARSGSAVAGYHYGMLKLIGKRTPKDLTEAVKWLQAAAEQDQPRAVETLVNLSLGLGELPADWERAEHWVQAAERLKIPKHAAYRAHLEKARPR